MLQLVGLVGLYTRVGRDVGCIAFIVLVIVCGSEIGWLSRYSHIRWIARCYWYLG